jgi:hypothetical protein
MGDYVFCKLWVHGKITRENYERLCEELELEDGDRVDATVNNCFECGEINYGDFEKLDDEVRLILSDAQDEYPDSFAFTWYADQGGDFGRSLMVAPSSGAARRFWNVSEMEIMVSVSDLEDQDTIRDALADSKLWESPIEIIEPAVAEGAPPPPRGKLFTVEVTRADYWNVNVRAMDEDKAREAATAFIANLEDPENHSSYSHTDGIDSSGCDELDSYEEVHVDATGD